MSKLSNFTKPPIELELVFYEKSAQIKVEWNQSLEIVGRLECGDSEWLWPCLC